MHRSTLGATYAALVVSAIALTLTDASAAQAQGAKTPPVNERPATPATPAHPTQPARPAPRYLAAIDGELEALSIPHACEAQTETRAQCSFHQRGRASGRELTINLVYSDETDTVYVYVSRLVFAMPDAETTPRVLRRLMELNWQLLVGKLEWNEADGEVRMSMVLNTDSNFDRRAFRSIVRQIAPLADRYFDELSRLSGERRAAEDADAETGANSDDPEGVDAE